MNLAALMLAALLIEGAFGWPRWLHARIAHPVVWLGTLISVLDKRLNRPDRPHGLRYALGAGSALAVILVTVVAALAVGRSVPANGLGFAIEAIIAASLVAGRSLNDHVEAVRAPLTVGDVDAARGAVAKIVGRDPASLDEAGIARAALESLAENASDGVVAPILWGLIFGLPGIAAYKAINTLDSMIGHRTTRYLAFGGFAARLDDIANFVPARLTAVLLAFASGRARAFAVMLSDAGRHRSPNAGWPEAALAGGLGVRLSGPRSYDGHLRCEPWLNAAAPDPGAAALRAGLVLYRRALAMLAFILCALIVIPALS